MDGRTDKAEYIIKFNITFSEVELFREIKIKSGDKDISKERKMILVMVLRN